MKSPLIDSYKILDMEGVVDNFYYNTFDISQDDFVGFGI